MTWPAAMRWALLRHRDDGRRRLVYGYRLGARDGGGWAYAVGYAVME